MRFDKIFSSLAKKPDQTGSRLKTRFPQTYDVFMSLQERRGGLKLYRTGPSAGSIVRRPSSAPSLKLFGERIIVIETLGDKLIPSSFDDDSEAAKHLEQAIDRYLAKCAQRPVFNPAEFAP